MRRQSALLLVLAALAGCGGDEPTAKAPAPAPSEQAAPPADSGGAAPFIGSLTVDPGDGTLIAGTGMGAFRLAPGAKRAKPFDGELRTPGATGAISSNLMLRFTAPGELIASGHPKDEGSGLPEYIGLIRSRDGCATWAPVSLLGEVDLHARDARGDVVAGQPVEEQRVLVSTDRGKTFQERTPLAVPVDVDIDPAQPERIAITTADGLFISGDGGASWRRRDVLTTQTHLAWSDTGPLYRVDAAGVVNRSDDAGESWKEAGNAGGAPSTMTVDAKGRLYVALAGAVIKRSKDGGKSFKELTRLTVP